MAINPIARFHRWFEEARTAGTAQTEAMTLATADAQGRPSARVVLLKHVDRDGFVFYTNALSRKGRELEENSQAALAFYWEKTGKQVRIEGETTLVTEAEADAYWATRPRASQLGALASEQSAPLTGRGQLMAHWRALERKFRGAEIPRPQYWTGYRVVPRAIEFWTFRAHRLHDRELFRRTPSGWTRERLQP